MSDAETPVECAAHGSTPSTYVCQHIANGRGNGFVTAWEPDEEDPWPDAWCNACDQEWEKRGEWTDSAAEIAAIKLLCTHCYEEARLRNLQH